MSKRKHQNRVHGLSRLLSYILGHRPDEFGLIPDTDGFVTYKELLKAIHEEPGWGHVTRGSINEVLLGEDRGLFRSEEGRIRAADIRWRLDTETPCDNLPKILYTAVRRKAHPVVLERGLVPAGERYLVFGSDEERAIRIGKRRDQKPVLLQIVTSSAVREGIPFYAFGDLFISPAPIPATHILAPPLPKTAAEKIPEQEQGRPLPRPIDFAPGTFVLDASRDPDPARGSKGKKKRGWKEAARKFRKGKSAIR